MGRFLGTSCTRVLPNLLSQKSGPLSLGVLLLLMPLPTSLEQTASKCTGDADTCNASEKPVFDAVREHFSESADCVDEHADCQDWAAMGECERNPTFMLVDCKVSCGTCHSTPKGIQLATEKYSPDHGECIKSDHCQDCNENCQLWADSGECQANPYYMKSSCAASCGFCMIGDPHPSEHPDCQDHHYSCRILAKEGACHYKRSFMMSECQRSCRVCGEEDPCRPNASDAGLLQRPGALKEIMERIIKTENVTVLSSDPYVVLIHNVISDENVGRVTDIFSKNWERSRVGGVIGKDSQSEMRTSQQQWCRKDCEDLPPMAELTRRVEGIIGAPRRNFEDLQVLRYKAGEFYKEHCDYIPDQVMMPVGPRVFTLFLYLNDVEGGSTYFPVLNISVSPKKGTLLLWPSVLDSKPYDGDERTLHEGLPPEGDSIKLAVNFWVHQFDFRTYNELSCLWSRRPRSSYTL